VVVHYSAPDKTRRCLQACLELDYPSFTVILVDNKSPDRSGRQLREEFSDTPILFLLNEENEGFAAGNNLGIALGLSLGAQAVWLLNSDARPEPDALSALVRVLGEHEGVGGVGSKIYYDSPSKPPIFWGAGGALDSDTREVTLRGAQQPDLGQFQLPAVVDYLPGCSLLVPLFVLQEVGLMDERYFLYFEDTDWSLAIRRQGLELYYAPSSIVWQTTSDELLQHPTNVYYFNRNTHEFWWRNGSGIGVPRSRTLARAFATLWQAASALWSCNDPQKRAIFYAHFFAALHFITRHRGRMKKRGQESYS